MSSRVTVRADRRIGAELDGQPLTHVQPRLDEVGSERLGSRLVAERECSQFEEEALLVRAGRVRQRCPDGHERVGGVHRDHTCRSVALLTLDLADDGSQKTGPRPEVVHEHAVTRADRGPDRPQAGVTEAVLVEVVDDGRQQVLSWHLHQCTIWYMSQRINVTDTSLAPPDRVFALLIDTAGWPDWAPMTSGTLEQPAPGPEPEGVGAIRRFTTGRTVSVERVVAFERDRAFTYELVSGLPLRDYRADVTLTPTRDGGTEVTWHSEFRPRWVGTGWAYRFGLGRFIRDLTGRLCREAERSTVDRP